MLQANEITVALGRKVILDRVSFEAAAGEITCIVGPNGSGKTTLMRALTGDLPYSGHVFLNGVDIADLKPWELSAMRGVLPQASVLAFPFTVAEVVQIGLTRGVRTAHSHGRDEELTMAALARVDLLHYANRHFQELSGGEQQRVQLARVLAQVWQPVLDNNPRWLFLDEPVSALDIAHQLQVMRIASDFAQGGGGVVAVMHDLNLTAMYADRITLLSEGAVLADGAPVDVMTDATLSTAYGCALTVGQAPAPGTPFLLPHMARGTAPHPAE
ncbi:MAG: heme ABC transporter ATP-binding protein [Pelagimonas sp.]|jgi:iron complex transport system ATP-binding protein|nr:heme ABC transporter ATP-binding protein [Pelagimonas sp.]